MSISSDFCQCEYLVVKYLVVMYKQQILKKKRYLRMFMMVLAEK